MTLCNGTIAYLKILLKGVNVIINCNETLVASAECNLIISVVPPVVHRGTIDDVAELDHVHYLAQAVLANPAVAASSDLVYRWRYDVPVRVRWRSNPIIFILGNTSKIIFFNVLTTKGVVKRSYTCPLTMFCSQ